MVLIGVGILRARTAFFDVDFDFLRDEIGVAFVADFDEDGSLAFFQADDVKSPSAVFLVMFDFGDALVGNFPVEAEAIFFVWSEEVAIFGDKAHGQQGRFQAVAHFDFTFDFAVFVADDLLAAVANNQADGLGVFFFVLGIDGVVVVAAASDKEAKAKMLNADMLLNMVLVSNGLAVHAHL